MDTNKKKETSSDSFDDIDQKIHANQILYDQLHQSLVDEVTSPADEDKSEKNINKGYSIIVRTVVAIKTAANPHNAYLNNSLD